MLSTPSLSLKHSCPWRLGGQIQTGLCQENLTWLEHTFDSKVAHAQVGCHPLPENIPWYHVLSWKRESIVAFVLK